MKDDGAFSSWRSAFRFQAEVGGQGAERWRKSADAGGGSVLLDRQGSRGVIDGEFMVMQEADAQQGAWDVAGGGFDLLLVGRPTRSRRCDSDLQGCDMAHAHTMREAVGMGPAASSHGFAERFAEKVIARLRFDGDEIVPMGRLQLLLKPLVIDPFAFTCDFQQFLRDHVYGSRSSRYANSPTAF